MHATLTTLKTTPRPGAVTRLARTRAAALALLLPLLACAPDPVQVAEDAQDGGEPPGSAPSAAAQDSPTEYELEGGIRVVIQEAGRGPEVFRGDEVVLHYRGSLVDGGVEFDSSYASGAPRKIPTGPGSYIPGLKRALVGLHWGTRATLTIPAALAYGERGNPPMIPPNADLRFEVHVIQAR